MKRIFVSCISLLLLLLVAIPAVGATKKRKPITNDTIPLYSGMFVGFDLLRPISMALGDTYKGLEASYEVGLKRRYYPIAEIGAGNYEYNKNNIDFKTNGMFGRIGVNYNMFSKANNDYIGYLGIRYAYAYQKYDYAGIAIDGYWDTEMPFNHIGILGHTHWAEFLIGIKVKLIHQFYMGWTFRLNMKIGEKKSSYGTPYYVPGFGKNGDKSQTVNFSLYYKF